MKKQIFITISVRGYSDSSIEGPFTSVEEGKEKVTDGVDRGIDGDETCYTFHELTTSGFKYLGYVLILDECEGDEDNLRSEQFYDV